MMLTTNDIDRRRYEEVEKEINELQVKMDKLNDLSYMDKTPEILEQLLDIVRRRMKLEIEQSQLQRRLR